MSLNVGNILDLIRTTLPKITDAVNTAQPIAEGVIDTVGSLVEQGSSLVDVGKSLFEGKTPDPAKLAAAEKLRKDLDDAIANS